MSRPEEHTPQTSLRTVREPLDSPTAERFSNAEKSVIDLKAENKNLQDRILERKLYSLFFPSIFRDAKFF